MSSQNPNEKSNLPQKTRDEIKAEREARKVAKAAAKQTKGKCSKNKIEADSIDTTDNVMIPTGSDIIPKMNTNDVKTDKTKKENSKSEKVIPSSNDIVADETKIPIENEGKSKAELRAERRAKQEAQRAAKQQQSSTKNNVKAQMVKQQAADVQPAETASKSPTKKIEAKNPTKKSTSEIMNLFSHLCYKRESSSIKVANVNSTIHPAIVKLGAQYANKIIVGSNVRCIALLTAIKQLLIDFEKPVQADFVRGFEVALKQSLAYLYQCRPLAISMPNEISHLHWQMAQFPLMISDDEARNKLHCLIDTYIKEQIELANQAISLTIQTKISENNVILTYGYSSLIQKILMDAHAAGKQFRVIIVDGRPWLEGKELLRRLTEHGIECSYIMINALHFIMPEIAKVSKVFLGAHTIFANGTVMSRIGSAQVALIARAFNVPILVACETHKFCERVQTDCIIFNELSDANKLINKSCSNSKKSVLANWQTKKSLPNILNITYDVMPADFVSAVVTELGILPITSVPVILRITN